MILVVIGFLTFCQVLLSVVANERRINWLNPVVLLILLTLYIFILPSFFYPPPPPEGKYVCGMPILGITLAFWIFGSGSALITYLACSMMKKRPQ